MKKLMIIAAAAAMLAGCGEDAKKAPSEAEIFGYKGQDLKDLDDTMFFSTGPGVTNWVPSRVLTVYERYELSSNEVALIEAAGIITPALSCEKIPEGFIEKNKEPWFTTFAKDTEAFGKTGVTGFIGHFNEAKKVWETGETYFSTYYDDKTAALQALGELELEIAKFTPKKFHKFDGCWIAEYVRLRVMGLAGQRPDGKWTCMLSINDKCNPGCGPWEPEAAQQERVDEIAFKAEVKAWREAVDKIAKANHESVAAKAKAAEVPLFGEGVEAQPTGDGRYVYVRSGMFAMSNAVAKAVWSEKRDALETASASKLAEPETRDLGEYEIWYATGSNKLFTVRLDIAFPKLSTNAVENAVARGEWRELIFDNILSGNEFPPPPQRKRR